VTTTLYQSNPRFVCLGPPQQTVKANKFCRCKKKSFCRHHEDEPLYEPVLIRQKLRTDQFLTSRKRIRVHISNVLSLHHSRMAAGWNNVFRGIIDAHRDVRHPRHPDFISFDHVFVDGSIQTHWHSGAYTSLCDLIFCCHLESFLENPTRRKTSLKVREASNCYGKFVLFQNVGNSWWKSRKRLKIA